MGRGAFHRTVYGLRRSADDHAPVGSCERHAWALSASMRLWVHRDTALLHLLAHAARGQSVENSAADKA